MTVAVIDAYASRTIVSDVTEYSSRHGLPPIAGHFRQVVAPGTYVRPQNPRQDPEGWSGEETLDIEAVHTMAPGADIVYVGAPNNYRDLDAIMNRVVDKHLADIVTNSYGYGGEALPPGYIKPQEDTYIQAAAEGISLFFSSGDDGDETGGDPAATPTPDWPASSPWVTAVGGTSMGVTAGQQPAVRAGLADRDQHLERRDLDMGTAVLPLRQRRRHQPAVRAAVVPGRRRAARHRHLQRHGAARPGRAGRLGAG